jgi:hypothetical protein
MAITPDHDGPQDAIANGQQDHDQGAGAGRDAGGGQQTASRRCALPGAVMVWS